MSTFNETLNVGEVVVAIEERYDDNNGASSVAYVWDGKEVKIAPYSNGYTSLSYSNAVVDATDDDIALATDWWVNVRKDTAKHTYVGCVVTLCRSRKAPNKTPLHVVDYVSGGYNSSYGNYEPEEVCVDVDGDRVWVSIGCVKDIVKGVRPFWS